MKSKKIKDQKNHKESKVWTDQDPKIPSDVLGSYTGTPLSDDEKYEKPIQDADDL